jgi:PAS domain S-box-containing protein
MMERHELPFHGLDENAALRSILEGTATETGERFFQALVKNLAKALNTEGAWVTEYLEESEKLRAFAFWMNGEWISDYEYVIAGTPCAYVIKEASILHVPENVVELYPLDPDLAKFHAVSYIGAPLLDIDGKVLGHLAVMDSHPLPENPQCRTIIQIFAGRASAEHQRLRAESKVREREEKVGRLLDSAMDAIIEMDDQLMITRANPAAVKAFRCSADQLEGKEFTQFLAPAGRGKIAYLATSLKARPTGEQSLWVPDGLDITLPDGKVFPAEATLSRFEMQRKSFFTLILRNVNDLLEAQEKIRSLTMEAEYLKEEIKNLGNFGGMVGQSKPFLRVLRDISEVAETDATVLVIGETGTGKELIARSIHESSGRKDQPLISVNCAAIPSTLIESEFFGHEKGAFTGAVAKREGRFALADRGTIFLDEIGELPLDVQAKLLRVLQEGEFEPLGSSKTRSVNVRVVAATNQNLKQAVQNKMFREDLFYRLNVFPIEVPPLRDRGEDVVLLAASFAEKIAARMRRSIAPFSPDCIRRLKSYDWPGNVRELQNVIERAVITSRDGILNLDRALPDSKEVTGISVNTPQGILTLNELNDLERNNIIRALESVHWRVSGEGGAAQLLGMNASTLSSRMKALGIKRPR